MPDWVRVPVKLMSLPERMEETIIEGLGLVFWFGIETRVNEPEKEPTRVESWSREEERESTLRPWVTN